MVLLANKYAGAHPFEDAAAVGRAAVLDAVRTHDPSRGALSTWVYTKVGWAIRRMTLDQRAPAVEHVAEVPERADEEAELPDALLEGAERVEALRAAVAELPEREREIMQSYLATGKKTRAESKSWDSRVFARGLALLKERMRASDYCD